jgi:hypothetical protein
VVFSSFNRKDNTSVTDIRLKCLHNGYQPIPTREKRPVLDDWQIGDIDEQRILTEGTRTVHYAPQTGIRTGEVVAVDVDIYDPDHVSRIADLIIEELGPTPLIRQGAKGGIFVYRNRTPIPKLAAQERSPSGRKRQGVEVLGLRRQFVAFGIHHETHRPYTWLGDDPTTVPMTDLPEVTRSSCSVFVTVYTTRWSRWATR